MAGAFGSIPSLSSSGGISDQIQSILGKVVPGFSNLIGGASDYTKNLLSGQLSPQTTNAIQNGAATWGQQSGMPGLNPNTIGANGGLKTLGLTSLGQQQQGFGNVLDLLKGVSGTVAPTFGQAQDQSNTANEYAAAPDPASNIKALISQYQNAMNPAAGRGNPNTPVNNSVFTATNNNADAANRYA